MEDLNEDFKNEQISETQEEAKPNLNMVRVLAILFILAIYLFIFAKILFLK